MDKILETINLSYKDFLNINLSFAVNTYYSIIGSNNSGKTTLFKLISGIILSNDMVCCNDVVLNNENINEYIVNFGIAERYNKNSFIYNTIFDEMTYPLYNLGFSKKYCINRINELLDNFGVDKWVDKNINELDYYEKNLLLIIIALLHQPKVLLLDSVLDIFPKKTRNNIINNIRKINKNITIISFTNSLESAYDSDRIILIDDKKIVGEYLPSDIYKDDKLFYEHKLEIPFLVDLSVKLKMYDLVDKEYTSMKELVDDIWP